MTSYIYSFFVSLFFILKFSSLPLEVATAVSYIFYFFYIITFFILILFYKKVLNLVFQKFDFLVFNIYVLISVIFIHPSHEARIFLVHFVGLWLVALLASILWKDNRLHGVLTMTFVFSLLSVLSLYVSVVYPSIGINHEGRWMGITHHPNTLGTISLIMIWICLLNYCFQNKIFSNLLYSFLLIVSFINIIKSNSMTSLVLSFFLVIFIMFYKYFYSFTIKIVIVFLSIFFLFLLICKGLGLGINFNDLYLSFFEMIGRKPTFTGRDVIWQQAIAYIERSPFVGFGLGVGSDIVVTNHYHNGYLQTLVRLGWVGLTLLCLSFFNLLYFTFYSKKDVLLNTASVSFLAIMLIHNVTESTFLVYSSSMWVVFLVIYFSCTSNGDSSYQKLI